MSRIGRMTIAVPSGVKVNIEGNSVVVEGPKGSLKTKLPEGIQAELSESVLVAKRENDRLPIQILDCARTPVDMSMAMQPRAV